MPELDSRGGGWTSSRQNMATGLERSILAKACSLMWDWTIFMNPFPDPITLTEEVRRCWNHAQDELGFSNFADATPPSSEQIWAKHRGCRSQYLHTAKKDITELYKLDIDDPMGCRQRVEYLLEGDRFTCPPNNYELFFQNFPSLFQTVVRLNQSNLTDSRFLLDS
ncbi:hypothetical protein L873DRAFT_827102 [Choiromyces venosus 120613-1]|uniref:DUF6532 domain-containing protein n=1 Tax=Choiromyces venosus 120613-1 TaxID=1336337 RepID=A0A3N4ITW5_9PEZI|nr:hypothetical protein L873DRAFT_827102 [Choiromyces venosus 120613-1]